MAIDIKVVSGRNSSAIVSYYLRTSETGWYVTTDVLKDAAFREAIEQSVVDRAKELSGQLPLMRSQVKIDSITSRLQHLKVRVPKPVGGDSKAHALVRTVHKAGLSLLLDKATARTGAMFQVTLPNKSVSSVDLIAKQVRDLFPKNCPMMITIHHGDEGKNLHLQGWYSDRPWNFETKSWGAPDKMFRTRAGLRDFHDKIDKVLEKFNAAWSVDPLAPKRTVFHPAKSQFMRDIPRDELLKGDFLSKVENKKLRSCLTEEVERARYFDRKYRLEEKQMKFSAETLGFMTDIRETYRPVKAKPFVQAVVDVSEHKTVAQRLKERIQSEKEKKSFSLTSENEIRESLKSDQFAKVKGRRL